MALCLAKEQNAGKELKTMNNKDILLSVPDTDGKDILIDCLIHRLKYLSELRKQKHKKS